MLVYGDPQFRCSLQEALHALQQTLEQTDARNLDSLRRLLIQLGQMEQAIGDVLEEECEQGEYLLPQIQTVTHLAAELFCSCLCAHETNLSLRQIQNALSEFPLLPCTLTMKIPEGFEFYRLFPEQFIFSALAWNTQHETTAQKSVLVIGIRSIGTTLSAVVAAVLQRAGWSVRRISVRPTGHPFERTLETPIPTEAGFVIIVDEGPGISGSSMVAAAEAVAQAGVARERISFFPGHENEPGETASETVREWWSTTPRFFTPFEAVRSQECDLSSTLLQKSAELCGKPFEKCEDLSGGLWRKFVFPNYRKRPPSFAPFERAKYLCTAGDGSALLWKFTGLGSLYEHQASQRNPNLSRYVVMPIGFHSGFSASPWIPGERLIREAISEPLIEHFAEYLLTAAKAPLSPDDHEGAIDRLEEMTFWNTKSKLGEAAAKQAVFHAGAARQCNLLPSYGDGRLAPWEWIRTQDGSIVKTDWLGHDTDHTLVSRQSLLWDVAGLLVEWNFSELAERHLVTLLNRAKIEFAPDALTFFRTAYSAFKLGQSAQCEKMVSDSADKELLEKATRFYCHRLSGTIQ